MDQVDRSPNADLPDDDSTNVARAVERDFTMCRRAVERDFTDLIAIFDRQLANLPIEDATARRHIAAARTAARRGLKLSRELLAKFRS
jgi:hypothetical protein